VRVGVKVGLGVQRGRKQRLRLEFAEWREAVANVDIGDVESNVERCCLDICCPQTISEKKNERKGTIVIDSTSKELRVAMRAGNTEVGVCLAAVVTGLSMAGGW
jgi:hypothetical protein